MVTDFLFGDYRILGSTTTAMDSCVSAEPFIEHFSGSQFLKKGDRYNIHEVRKGEDGMPGNELFKKNSAGRGLLRSCLFPFIVTNAGS